MILKICLQVELIFITLYSILQALLFAAGLQII